MSVSASKQSDTQPPLSIKAYLISSLLILIGVGTILFFFLAISRSPDIQFALNWIPSEEYPTQPSLLLAFLDDFGIIISILIISLSILMIGIGVQLRSGRIQIAYWAKTALVWLSFGFIVLILLNTYNLLRAFDIDGEVITPEKLLTGVIPFITGLIITGFVWYWLQKNIEVEFHGEDPLIARETRLAWSLLIPTLTIFILVAARPLEQTFIRSLTDKRFAGSGVPQFVGLENYMDLLSIRIDRVSCREGDSPGTCSGRWQSIDRELLQEGYRTVWNFPVPFSSNESYAISGLDDDFIGSIGTTLIFAVVSVTFELLIGLFIAVVVNSRFRGRGLMRAVMLVPWAIPTVISARLWELMLKDTSAGIVNKVMMDLQFINSPQAWLSDPTLQIPIAIVVDVWKTAPFMALLLLAGLQTIPKDLYEAADVDGASPIRRFFAITIPLLRPAIALALIFRTLDALRVFDLFNVLFGRQQLSMATYNFETLVSNQLDGYASAISVIIFVFISIFAFIYVRLLDVETE